MGQGPFFSNINLIDEAINIFSEEITTGLDNLRNLAPDLRARFETGPAWDLFVDWGDETRDISGLITYGIDITNLDAPTMRYTLWDDLYPALGSKVAEFQSPIKDSIRYPNLDPKDTSGLTHDGEFIQHAHAFTAISTGGFLVPSAYTCKTLQIRFAASLATPYSRAIGYIGAYNLDSMTDHAKIGYDASSVTNFSGTSAISSQGAVASSANVGTKSFNWTAELSTHVVMQKFRGMISRVGTDLPFFFLRVPSDDANIQRYDRITEGGLVRAKKATNKFAMNEPSNTTTSNYRFDLELTPWR